MSEPARRHRLTLLLLALALLAAGSAPAAREPVQHVVYHINAASAERQMYALRNIRNHLAAAGPGGVEIRVVLQGRGIGMLVLPEALPHLRGLSSANGSPQMLAMVDALRDQGVRFLVCGNSLRRYGVDPEEDLYNVEPFDIVPSGVIALAELQQRGYAYIKP